MARVEPETRTSARRVWLLAGAISLLDPTLFARALLLAGLRGARFARDRLLPQPSALLDGTAAGVGTQLVITGFIASSKDGAPTTLKRDGSDYSASIFGRLLGAR